MNLLDATVVEIVEVKEIDFGSCVKRIVECKVECWDSISEHTEMFDLDQDWEKEIYVGKKIVV